MAEKKHETLFGQGTLNTAFAQYFIKDSFLNPLANADGVDVCNVTFEPGCRNNWHIHHNAHQILLCTDGRGWYQEEGQEAVALLPGTVIDIHPGVKHWHGAQKDSWFAHVSITTPAPAGLTASHEWLEPVDDDWYDKLSEV